MTILEQLVILGFILVTAGGTLLCALWHRADAMLVVSPRVRQVAISAILGLMAFAYVLSIGPAMFASRKGLLSPGTVFALQTAYAPLSLVEQSVPGFTKIMFWYKSLWLGGWNQW